MLLGKKGFTLIELLLSLAIISILVGVAITIINPIAIVKRSRDSRRKSDLEAIRQALELYRADNGNYPTGGWRGSGGGGDWIGGMVSDYISQLPIDPINDATNSGPCYSPKKYRYNYSALDSGQRYILTAMMETESGNNESPCDYNGWCGGHNTDNYCYQVQNP